MPFTFPRLCDLTRSAKRDDRLRSRPSLLPLEDRVVPTNIGDGFDDVVTGAGAANGGAPHVRIFSGAALGAVSATDPASQAGVLFNFFAGFTPGFHGGVKVATGDAGGDHTTAEVVVTVQSG